MSDVAVGALGALAGLLVALFGNVLVLPFVLRTQDDRFSDSWKSPVFGWNKVKVAKLTKLMYRVQMPVLFSIIGAMLALQMFGGRP